MSNLRCRWLLVAVVSVLFAAAGRADAQAKPEPSSPKGDVAAQVAGEAVTIQELDAKILKTNMKLAQSLYEARRAAIDQVVIDRVLAKEAAGRGIPVDQLMKERLAEKAKPVTDADVEAFYSANSARMGGKTLEQVSGQIRSQLASQREGEARQNLIAELKTKADVRVTLEPPRVTVAVAPNDPIKGPADAKVTIVEFSDFQ
jgi:protein-disulfide isomerase